MRYLCLVYFEQTKLDALPQSEYDALIDALIAYSDELRQSGHHIASDALQPAQAAVSVRVCDGRVVVGAAPLHEPGEQLGGFYLIDAWDLNDAIRVAAAMPQARSGPIVVRPVVEPGQE